jgi:hypothetical protein
VWRGVVLLLGKYLLGSNGLFQLPPTANRQLTQLSSPSSTRQEDPPNRLFSPREVLPPRRLIAQWHPDQGDWRAAPIFYILALLHSHTESGEVWWEKNPPFSFLVLSLARLNRAGRRHHDDW